MTQGQHTYLVDYNLLSRNGIETLRNSRLAELAQQEGSGVVEITDGQVSHQEEETLAKLLAKDDPDVPFPERDRAYPFSDDGITREQYSAIGIELEWKPPEAVRADLLLAVEHESVGQPIRVNIETDEFTAVCPWTGLPDTGRVKIAYTPTDKVLELKALKFYLLSYRDVGIIQEDAASRLLNDLVECCQPDEMTVELDYAVRGGLRTVVTAEYSYGAMMAQVHPVE